MFWTRDLTTSKGFDTMLACKRRCIEWHIKQGRSKHMPRVTFARMHACNGSSGGRCRRCLDTHHTRTRCPWETKACKHACMHKMHEHPMHAWLVGLWACALLAYAYVAIRCLHLSSTSSSRAGNARRREERIHSANEAPHAA
jgi:hypothetical protein